MRLEIAKKEENKEKIEKVETETKKKKLALHF